MHRISLAFLLLPACRPDPMAEPALRPLGEGRVELVLARGLDAELGEGGLVAHAGMDELGLATVSYGGLALAPIVPTLGSCVELGPAAGLDTDACIPTAELRHGPLTEWWANTPRGLRQGWTLHAPVELDDRDADAVIALSLTAGTLREVAWNGRSATFVGTTGHTWRYHGLAAWDALGSILSATLEATQDGLQVRVQTAGAAWPITVDPILDDELELTASDAAADDYFGETLAGAGDVDGDGLADLIVGAANKDNVASSDGGAYVYLGSTTGIAAASEVLLLASDAAAYDYLGASVAGVGDLDGDGYSDVAVGADSDDDGGSNSGSVYVWYGSSSGIDTASEHKVTASNGASNDLFGYSVGGGDVDGDGLADLAVGAYGASSKGAVYLYAGSTSGLSTSSEVELEPASASSGDFVGYSVTLDGDLDGDGYADLVTGASSGDAVYVFYGSSTGLVSGSEQRITADDLGSSDRYGWALGSGGDLDGDGFDDLAIGARNTDDAAYNAGSVYVYYGSATGVRQASVEELHATIPTANAAFGSAVSLVGDLDADGLADLLVGATGASTAYAFMGGPAGVSGTAEQEIVGDGYLGGSVAILGDTDGDGADDVALGAHFSDSAASRAGAVHVYEGGCATDADGDGACGDADCDDTDPDIHPWATEGVGDEVDQDCDGTEVCYADADDDGYTDGSTTVRSEDTDCTDAGEGADTDPTTDCDDSDSSIHPGAAEGVGDEVDSDCDGTEVCYADADGDGYIDGSTTVASADPDCRDAGEGLGTAGAGECDDTDATIHPGATERVGDEVDSDCDGGETCYADGDDDGYTDRGTTVSSTDTDCTDKFEASVHTSTGDCDDADPRAHPAATEQAGDGVDSDCDGLELCYVDADDDGYPDFSQTVESGEVGCTGAGEGTATDRVGECDDGDASVHPGATEFPGDEVDSDCDSTERCYVDGDGDGYTDGSSTVASDDLDCSGEGEASASLPSGDCDDADARVRPGAAEELVGDGVDQDCDGAELCYADADDDGYTDASTTVHSEDIDCTDPGEGMVTDATGDCDDADAQVNPGAVERADDGIDNDCDGEEALTESDEEDTGEPASGGPGDDTEEEGKGGCSTVAASPGSAPWLLPAGLTLLLGLRRRSPLSSPSAAAIPRPWSR